MNKSLALLVVTTIFTVQAYAGDGTLDTTFGTNGITSFSNPPAIPYTYVDSDTAK